MKLIICDTATINTYQLPDKIEDVYIISDIFKSNVSKETLYLEAYQNYWSIKTDETIQVKSDGKIESRAILKEYTSYQIKFSDSENIVDIYIVPDLEQYMSLTTIPLITIGNSNDDTICYQSLGINGHQVTIKNTNGYYIISEQEGNSLYVNTKKTKQKILQLGDVIFLHGLKIIWMEQYIKINNPQNKVICNNLSNYLEPSLENTYTQTTDIEKNIKLYNDNQIFFHTPRLKPEIKKEHVKIDAPPEEERNEQMPMVLTIGSSAIIGITSCVTGISALNGLMNGTVDLFNAVLEFIMCGLMLVACILFPMLMDMWQKKRIKKKEKLRQRRYKEYLDKKNTTIDNIIEKQRQILYKNNLSLKEIENSIINHDNNIWNREIIDNDFLTVRLGIGDRPCAINVDVVEEGFSLYDDNLKDEVIKMTNEKRMIENVPITLSLRQNRVTPFIINCNFRKQYIDSLLLQLIYYYSGIDLKIVIFTNELNASDWEYLKYMPHNFSKDKERRLFATNENEMIQLSMFLEQEYEKRLKENEDVGKEKKDEDENAENPYKNFDDYYLIITDDFKVVKDIPIIERIINSSLDFGFSIMIFETLLKNLPSRFNKFVSIVPNSSGIYERTLDIDTQMQFNPEYLETDFISSYSRVIANIPVLDKSENKNIPSTLPFLDMYKVGRVDQLNILSRWKENDPTVSLHAPIGEKEYEKILELDLHEKYHGPHGLIAGSTGSGKSEFIMSYILSMAINYDPREVQFILIDYKGGGLALAFENRETNVKIPHLVGTITNLDTSEMNRTLVSIKSELQRRQIKFNNARNLLGEGTIDIYKYQRLYREGKVTEPISHLFVIADEFAELKDQQPDFMDELVSTARIGRSLGVHLILSTQKPSGVVNDQIWSNSRFHVCLKVQTNEDSVEMLKKSDAANIKETGRFYLQVGNDEIFEYGQSAWAGAKYIPVNRLVKKIDDSIEFISTDGTVIKKINDELKKEETVEQGEQLTNIVKYLYDVANREKIPFTSLWLPSIANDIYLGNLIKKYNYQPKRFPMEVIIGEYDKPAKQEQGLYKLDLTCQNTVIFGLPGSGKENMLSTLIFNTCLYYTPNSVAFYILDFGSESLKVFNKMPHVGDVILSDEREKVEAYFEHLDKEIKKRKELFNDYSGDYVNYCKSTNQNIPLIVTVLNGYESFMEICGDLESDFMPLFRDGGKYGIIFITTVVSTNSMRSGILDCFANKVLLQVADEFDYRYILDAPIGLIPKKVFGRGIASIMDEACEFQTAYIADKGNISNVIKNYSKQLYDQYKFKHKEIKVLPKSITMKDLLKYTKTVDKIPLGIYRDEVEIAYYNFIKNKINLILGDSIIDDLTFMCGVIDLFDSIKGIKLNILDFITCVQTDGNAHYYNLDFKSAFTDIMTSKEPTINILLGFGDFDGALSPDELELFNQIMMNPQKYPNQIFIIIDNYERFCNVKSYPWYPNITKTSGIWYGHNIENQDVFVIEDIKDYDIEDSMQDIVFIIEDKKYKVIKGIGEERDGVI